MCVDDGVWKFYEKEKNEYITTTPIRTATTMMGEKLKTKYSSGENYKLSTDDVCSHLIFGSKSECIHIQAYT